MSQESLLFDALEETESSEPVAGAGAGRGHRGASPG